MSPAARGTTVRALLAESLRAAARSGDTQEPPVAVLWADPDRAWEPAIRPLQEALPVLELGDWTGDGETARGPALWLRAVLASPDDVPLPAHLAVRAPQDTDHPDRPRTPWVIYLPGVRRHELTDMAQIPEPLKPLADVALRSVWWAPPSGQNPWTPHSFLASKHGAHLDLAGDAATRQALAELLPRLLDEDVDALRNRGRLDAARLHQRVMPDAVRTLLGWIDDPTASRERLAGAEWTAFAHTCRTTFGIDPDKDTHLTAAARLGARDGEWAAVWQRFVETARHYSGIHTALDQARPKSTLFADDDPHPDSWPSWNHEQEDLLRDALASLATLPETRSVRERLTALAAEHAPRSDSVWAELGLAPLARAVALLGDLVEAATDVAATDVATAAAWYAERGHVADRLAIEARAAVAAAADLDAVLSALHAVYDPWVDTTARTFQALVAQQGYVGATGLGVEPGTCVVYVDALRIDLAHRLATRLAPRTAVVDHRLAAFPTLTPTGQPAVAPVGEATRSGWGAGPDFDAGDAQGRSLKGPVLRTALAGAGVQYLEWDGTGDPTGVAWTQTNDIDSAGHASKGPRFETAVESLLDRVAARVDSLLRSGWSTVVVVTDHGFLLPARPARKVTLSLAMTEGGGARKPRVARLRDGAPSIDLPTAPWTWDPTVTMASAPGASAFEEGVTYDHGGLSLQECVIPVITVSDGAGSAVEEHLAAQIHAVRWTGQRCRIDIVPPDAPVQGAIRLSPGDPGSTVGGPKAPNGDGEVKVLVSEEDAPEGTAAYVVLLGDEGNVVAQQQTTVGGDR